MTELPKDYPIRLRATLTGDMLQVKALLTHPMENGLSRDGGGAASVAHFITEITVYINDEPVASVATGSGVAANPLFGWRFAGANKGDRISLIWRDNHGLEKSAATVVA